MEVGATAYIPSKHSDFAIFTGLKDIRREEKESAPEEGGKGDAIAIALPLDNGDEAKEVAREDNKVGAKAATSEKQSDFAIFAQKEERTRRKQERALRRERKAKRKLRLAAVTEGDEEIGLSVAGSGNIRDIHESQTEAS